MKRFFQGPIIIVITVLLAGGGIVWAYQHRKSEKVLSYRSSIGTSSSLVAADLNISDEDWKKLLERVNTKTVATTTENLTNSDIISREILARLVLVKQVGKDVDADTAKKIVDDIMLYANSVDIPLKQYTIKDIKISATSDTQAASSYKTNLNKILMDSGIEGMGNELVIMEQALQSNDTENMSKLDAISMEYAKIASKLLTLSVPAPISKEHLNLINFYMRISKNVKAFSVVKTDPFIASLNFNDYVAANDSFTRALKNINTYLSSVGVNL